MVATLGLVFTGCIAAVRPAGHGHASMVAKPMESRHNTMAIPMMRAIGVKAHKPEERVEQ